MAAVAMTKEIAALMGPVVREWQRRGFDLDYGVGLAFGDATLGVVGFDGRYDYKPVGGVVNLAARLCAKAGPAQVLLDQATHAATCASYPSEQISAVELTVYDAAQRVDTIT